MGFTITTSYPDGRVESREATPEEVAQHEADQAAIAAMEAEEEAARQEREAIRESALAKLAALGLTEEEAAAIIK